MDNLVLNQNTISYIHVAGTVPIFINLFYMAYCLRYPIYICQSGDHMMVELNYLIYLTHLRKWQILVGRQ